MTSAGGEKEYAEGANENLMETFAAGYTPFDFPEGSHFAVFAGLKL